MVERMRPRECASVAWRCALIGLALTIGCAPATARQGDDGITPPAMTGLVVDAAHVLPQATRDDLTAKLRRLQHDTNRQLVVATVPNTGGRDVADYGYRLLRAWGVGLKDVNNGAILFIAPNQPKKGQRGPRIEVGYGLEAILTDAFSSTVIQRDMMPRLQADDIAGAMEAGTDAIVLQLRASPDDAKARTDAAVTAFNDAHRQRPQSSFNELFQAIGFAACMIAAFALAFIGNRRGQRSSNAASDSTQAISSTSTSGSGFDTTSEKWEDGSGSGGGGSGGGGGASGNW